MSKVSTTLAETTPSATQPQLLANSALPLLPPSTLSASSTSPTTETPPPPPPPPPPQPQPPPPPPPPPTSQASSLPPRPPLSQPIPRESSPASITPIIPALPMALAVPRAPKKTYPPTGIGRGHSSLPPKPGFVGKPLPRDTDAIVLTSGGESLSFAPPSKAKRTYSSVASETSMRPMDPAVTNLTPQNRVSPSALAPNHHAASNHHHAAPNHLVIPNHHAIPNRHAAPNHHAAVNHHTAPVPPATAAVAPQPRSLTPPAEAIVKMIVNGKEPQDLDSVTAVGSILTPPSGLKARPAVAHIQQQQQPSQNDSRQGATNGNTNTNNNAATDRPMDRPMMYRVDQHLPQSHDPSQQMGGFAANGAPLEMFHHHHMAHQFGFPPPLHPHQHQQGTFYPQQAYHGGTLTPPNTGTMFIPNSLQPQMENMLYNDMVGSPDSANGKVGSGGAGGGGGGGGAAQLHMFGPGYGYGHHPDPLARQHPMMQQQQQQLMMDGHGHQPEHLHGLRGPPLPGDTNFPPPPMGDSGRVNRSRISATHDPRLRGITFVAADDEAKTGKVNATAPDSVVAASKPPQSSQANATQANRASGTPAEATKSATENHHPVVSSTAPLEYYMAQQFLNSKLADCKLVLIRPASHVVEAFPAHSFVLGRSEKLCHLLQHAEKVDGTSSNNHPSLVRINSASSWADEVDGEELAGVASRGVKAVLTTRDGITTFTFETAVPRASFLLVLKTLYGTSDWELDAYLNPDHAAHHTVGQSGSTHDNSHSNDASSMAPHTMTNDDPSRSQQVRMLDRSIQIFATAVLLGLDDIMFKAIENIKRWGLHLEGGAFERLLKFLLYDSVEMKNDNALSSPHWGFTDGLLGEAIDLFAHSIPDGFKMDFRAPHSKFLNRLGTEESSPPSTVPTPALTAATQHQRLIRQIQSTVLLSIPFDVMKQILEHNALARGGRRRAFELSSSVIQERERRRKRVLKALQDQQQGGDRKNASESGSDFGEKGDCYPDVLCWEESAVSTFGHGGIGIEITRRRKGGPGGRMLWKIGARGGSN